tara:strand:- start:572 stop:1123 length:552 start_codon:yes stop_codon:yes gene_type:complete
MFCIHGDATLDHILKSASVIDAKGIAVALNTDQDNLFVTMTIRTLNSEAFLLSRCSNNQNRSKILRSGANKVINPYVTGGHRMAESLLRPEIIDIVSVTTPGDENLDLNIDEINVKNIPTFIGKTIKETEIRDNYDLMIVCIIHDNKSSTINPQSDQIIDINDTIMVIGDKEKLDLFVSEQTS